MSDDSKDDLSFDNDPGELKENENDLDFTFSDIPILGADKNKNTSFSFDTPEKDPALASFEALLSEQPKDDDDSEDDQTTDELSEDSKVTQSQIEIERVKAIRSAKRRKKKLVKLAFVGAGVTFVAALALLLFILFKPSAADNKAKDLTPKQLAALKAAKQKEKLDALMESADKLFENSKYDEALSLYKQVLEIDYPRSAAHLGLGKCLESNKKLDEAMKEYEKAINLAPETTASFNRLAHAYLKKDDKNKAKEILEKGALKFSDDQELLLSLANLYFELNDSEKALEYYKKLDTGNLEIKEINNFASLLQYESKNDAKKLLVTAARKFKNYQLYLSASDLVKDDEERLNILLDAEKERADSQESIDVLLMRIAEIYAGLDKKTETRNYLKKIKIEKLDSKLYAPVFKCARKAGLRLDDVFTIPAMKVPKDAKNSKVLTFLLYMLRLAPKSLDVQLLVLRELETTMPPDKVLDVYGDLCTYKRNSSIVCFLYAKAFQNASMIAAALKYYEKAVALKPDFYNPLLALGEIHLNQRQPLLALPFFKRCVELEPKANQPRELLTKAEILSGNEVKAMESYSKFLDSIKMTPSEKTLRLAEISMCMSTPALMGKYLSRLKAYAAMAKQYKILNAQKKLIFGDAKLSDFRGAQEGLLRQYKIIFLLSKGYLLKVSSVRTPKDEFPDFWKVYVLLKKNIIRRKRSLAIVEAALNDVAEAGKMVSVIARINKLPKTGDGEAAKARITVEDAEKKASTAFDVTAALIKSAAVVAKTAKTAAKIAKIAVDDTSVNSSADTKAKQAAAKVAEDAYKKAADAAAKTAVPAAEKWLEAAKAALTAAKWSRTSRAALAAARTTKIKVAKLKKCVNAFIAEKESVHSKKGNSILELLFEKTRGSSCIPKREIAAVWNGESCVENMGKLLHLIPENQRALYYCLLAEEYKYSEQRMKYRIALRKAMSAPRSVYRPLIERAYK